MIAVEFQMKKYQNRKQFYLNFIKNVARLGTGSALVLIHFVVAAGATVISKRTAKQNTIKALPYEKQ